MITPNQENAIEDNFIYLFIYSSKEKQQQTFDDNDNSGEQQNGIKDNMNKLLDIII